MPDYLGHSFPEIPQRTLKKLMSCWPNIFSLIFSDCLANLSDRLHTTLRISHLNSLRNVEWTPSGPDDSLLFTLWICFEIHFASLAVAGRSSNKHTCSKREKRKKKKKEAASNSTKNSRIHFSASGHLLTPFPSCSVICWPCAFSGRLPISDRLRNKVWEISVLLINGSSKALYYFTCM